MSVRSEIFPPGPDWSALPHHILGMIARRLIKLKDVIRFRAVCKRWSRAAPTKFRQSIPWLMLPYCSSGNYCGSSSSPPAVLGCKGTDTCRRYYDPAEKRFHHIELPQGLNRNCRGSAFGWTFMVDRTPTLFLLNPITRSTISLPPITAFPDVLGFSPHKVGKEYLYVDKDGFRVAEGKKEVEHHYLHRVALSAEPTSDECVVMVIRSPVDRTLAFCRPTATTTTTGDGQKWTLIPRGNLDLCFEDVVFWRGQFYALVDGGRVFVCDVSLSHHARLSLFLDSHRHIMSIRSYLVVNPANDELMMVARHVRHWGDDGDDVECDIHEWDCGDCDDIGIGSNDDEWTDDEEDDDNNGEDLPGKESDREVDRYGIDTESDDDDLLVEESQPLTDEVRVFKANEDRRGWDEVESIGDLALFLGYNSGTCISTRDHPEFTPNSIYFTDDMIHHHCKRRLAGADMGVYNLDTRAFTPFYCTASVHNNPSFIWPLPVWILPSNY